MNAPTKTFDAHQVRANPNLILVDLRPTSERYFGMGFIPGSIGLPRDPGVHDPDDPTSYVERLRRASGDRTPTLVCMSGARARECVEQIGPQLERPLAYLGGGVLGWAAEGLPLCGLGPPVLEESRLSPEEASRHMAACFVGELADAALDHDLDPLELLRECFERAGQSYDEPVLDQLHRVLDHAAVFSLRLGTPLERVAANIDRMLAMLPEPTRSNSA